MTDQYYNSSMSPKKGGGGTKSRLTGIEYAPVNVPMERRLQTLAVLMHLLFFTFGPLFYTEDWKWVPLLYGAWYFYDYNSDQKGGRDFT